jgi:hypothetical protein
MDAEGHIETLAELAARRTKFDQRPGALEATRCEAPAISVVGRRDPRGWQVLLLLGAVQARLTPVQARALAHDLVDCASLVEGAQPK